MNTYLWLNSEACVIINLDSLVNAEPLRFDLDNFGHVKSHWRLIKNYPVLSDTKRVIVTRLHRVRRCRFTDQLNLLKCFAWWDAIKAVVCLTAKLRSHHVDCTVVIRVRVTGLRVDGDEVGRIQTGPSFKGDWIDLTHRGSLCNGVVLVAHGPDVDIAIVPGTLVCWLHKIQLLRDCHGLK